MAGRTKRFFSKRPAVKQERRQARPAPVKLAPIRFGAPPVVKTVTPGPK